MKKCSPSETRRRLTNRGFSPPRWCQPTAVLTKRVGLLDGPRVGRFKTIPFAWSSAFVLSFRRPKAVGRPFAPTTQPLSFFFHPPRCSLNASGLVVWAPLESVPLGVPQALLQLPCPTWTFRSRLQAHLLFILSCDLLKVV